jgi:hypothetical protein
MRSYSAHNGDMALTSLPVTWERAVAGLRRLFERLTHRGRKPPLGGVREPRRPRPTLPSAAVALAEPRTARRRRIKLTRRRGDSQED